MIELVNVSKVYRTPGSEVRALDDVSLAVSLGEFVAVRGPSGSGKSTLLLAIGGMIRPTEGRVVVDGDDIYALSSHRRARLRANRIGFVFQMFHLVPYLNCLENVLLPALAGSGTGRREAVESLDRFQLLDRLRHRPATEEGASTHRRRSRARCVRSTSRRHPRSRDRRAGTV